MANPDSPRRVPFQWQGGYPIAILAVAAASFSVVWLNTTAPVAALMLAVIVSTWFGGTRPALFAVVASLPPLFYALPPHGSLAIQSDQYLRVLAFIGIACFIIWLVASERKASAALLRARDALQLDNAELAKENVEGKLQQEMLRRSERELRLVIDTIPTMAWILTAEGKIEFLNRRWLDYSGMSQEEACRYAHTTMHPEDSARAFDKANRAIAAGRAFEDEIRLRRHDGVYRWFLVRTVPRLDESGVVRHWYGTSTDIEDYKRAEEALRESAGRLQHLSRRLLEVHEEERRHFSRELHDEFGQLLVAINLHLHAAKGVAGEAAQPELAQSAALLRQAVDQVRGLALELRPTILETAGLAPTLQWLAGQHQQGTGLKIEVNGELGEVPADVAIACFRIVQQALTNIVQHARAREVWIDLVQGEGSIELEIFDDGRGFDVASTMRTAPGNGHLGLLGMRERVEILGGRMQVDSTPGEGTRITLAVPVPRTVTEGSAAATVA